MRKILLIAVIALLLFSISMIYAEGENWCDPGGPWGDGRCDNPNPDISAYYYEMGWCMAHNINPDTMQPATYVEGNAVDDSYSYHSDDVECSGQQYFSAAEGVLANDSGDVKVISFTPLYPHGEVMVWEDGSFRYHGLPKGGDYKFTYTVTGGDTAKVELHLCPGKVFE